MNLLIFRRNTDWLRSLVTGEKKWVLFLYVNHYRKKQWLGKKEKGVPMVKLELAPRKIMYSVWWNIIGVILRELLPVNSTMNANIFWIEFLKNFVKTKIGRVFLTWQWSCTYIENYLWKITGFEVGYTSSSSVFPGHVANKLPICFARLVNIYRGKNGNNLEMSC